MTRTNKKPTPEPTDLFARIRTAEAEEAKLPAEAYDLAVNALAADPNALEFEEVQRILKASGHTTADLERHIAVLRPFATGRDRDAREEIADAQAEVEAVGAERTALNKRIGTKLPTAEEGKQFEALSRRLAQAHRRIKAANAKLGEIERNRAALVAEIRGEELPSAPVVPTPEFTFEATPTQSKPPAGYDPYDRRWRKVYDPKGNLSYEFNGNRVSA
jgi:hypothetical protein